MERYDEMLRELGLKTLVLLEMHAEEPVEYDAQHILNRLAGSYVDLGVRHGGWPDVEADDK